MFISSELQHWFRIQMTWHMNRSWSRDIQKEKWEREKMEEVSWFKKIFQVAVILGQSRNRKEILWSRYSAVSSCRLCAKYSLSHAQCFAWGIFEHSIIIVCVSIYEHVCKAWWIRPVLPRVHLNVKEGEEFVHAIRVGNSLLEKELLASAIRQKDLVLLKKGMGKNSDVISMERVLPELVCSVTSVGCFSQMLFKLSRAGQLHHHTAAGLPSHVAGWRC